MPQSPKILVPFGALCALMLTACGGSETTAAEMVDGGIPDAPDAAIEMIIQELAGGNGEILWNAMPASYQGDLNRIAQLAGTKIDAELYDRSFALIGRLADVVDKQKTFVLDTEFGGKKTDEHMARVEAAWSSIIGFAKSICGSSIASAEGLQSFDGHSFFETTVSSLLGYTRGIASVSGEKDPFDFGAIHLLESDENTAVLELVSSDGVAESEKFTKVEGRWVPAEMASQWVTSMAQAKAKLEAISLEEIAKNKPQLMSIMMMVERILVQLEGAQTQEEFDQALQGAMMPLMGLMMLQGSLGPGGAPAMPTAPAMP